MKKILVLAVMATFLMLAGSNLWAQDNAKTSSKTLTGQVVCLTCYFEMNMMGQKHTKCAIQCMTNGMPVGLKVGNKLYLLIGANSSSVDNMMIPYAEQRVTVTGEVISKDGMRVIEVEKVKKF